MTPLVGITVCIDRGQRLRAGADYLYVRRAYAEQVRRAGAEPLLLTPDTSPQRAATLCDGFLITGGDDLPVSFDEGARAAGEHPEAPERIAWDRALLAEVSALAKPVLGVCYGMQLINLFCGGTLYQRLQGEHPGAVDHGGGPHTTHHALDRVEPSLLLRGLHPGVVVNSCHRQAVRLVAPGFLVTALTGDGIVEAMERPPFYAVEWHPETDLASRGIYDNFVALVRESAGVKAGDVP
jgi:putative glutamine amidotransferase